MKYAGETLFAREPDSFVNFNDMFKWLVDLIMEELRNIQLQAALSVIIRNYSGEEIFYNTRKLINQKLYQLNEEFNNFGLY